MDVEDARLKPLTASARISGRRLFWLLVTFLGAPILVALAIGAWEFLETQRIWTIIEENEGYTCLSPDSITIGDSYGTDSLMNGRPLFRYQIVKVSVGFRSRGDYVDFSQPPRPGTQHPLAVLERLPNLTEVMVSASRISPEGIACVARCRRLVKLDLSAKVLTAEQLQPLTACQSLRELGLDGASLAGATVAHLQALPELETLAFEHAQIDEAGMQELSRMKSLRDLRFFYTAFEQSALGRLAELPILQSLSISSFDMTHATYQGIGRLTGLRRLSLQRGTGWEGEMDRPTLSDEIAELSGLTELRELYLDSGRIPGASLETLLRFSHLLTLRAESELTDDEAIRLANGLKLNEFVLFSSKFNDPQRICNEVTGPKLYVHRLPRSWPGYAIASFEPR